MAMPKKGTKNMTVRVTPDTEKTINDIALGLCCIYGRKPSVSMFLARIASGKIRVLPEDVYNFLVVKTRNDD